MSAIEKNVLITHKTRELLEREAREDISKLCGELSGRINDYAECPDVLKAIKDLNHAMDVYIDVLKKARDEYESAVSVYADEQFKKYAD